jgi:RNA-splicing ligase RtcB
MTSFADDATMIRDGEPYREFDDGRIRVFGYSYDAMALSQITTVAGHGWVSDAALMADNHLGYSMPIGGVAGYRDMVSPSGVGYDIGCGVMAVRTPLRMDDVREDLPRIADEIATRLSFGIGRKSQTRVEHELFDSPIWQEVPELTQTVTGRKSTWSLRTRAEQQLGTVGSGNHYVDLLVEPADGSVWAACHFGSRGFGHGVATGFRTWRPTASSSRRCRAASRCTRLRRCSLSRPMPRRSSAPGRRMRSRAPRSAAATSGR